MYISPVFRIEDDEKVATFIGQNSFATVISQFENRPFASHLPILFEPTSRRLVGHMARANPQWQHFADGREILVVFQGPHAYISPRWYNTELAVPTWNYAVVHVYGNPRIIDHEQQVKEILRRTVRFYEGGAPDSWSGELPVDFESKLIGAIVAFDVAISRVEAKFKLGQNRTKTDLAGVHRALSQSTDPIARSLADLMRSEGLV